MLEQAGYEVAETLILPDDPEMLKTQLIRLADGRQVDLVVTSGGTGFSLRDQTPEPLWRWQTASLPVSLRPFAVNLWK